MLQKIHERVQGFIAWALIILIAVTFTLWGVNYYFEGHSVSDVQAEVNGAKVSKVDFSNTYQRLKRQAEEQSGGLSPRQEKSLKDRALKQLIFTRAIIQEAETAGYLITREQAEQALMQIPQFQEDGQFSAEKFQQTLSAALYTPSVFLTKIQEGLLINQQRFAFAGTEFVLPKEMNRLVGLAKQTRDFRYVIIPEKTFESGIQPSSDELQQYYQKNQAQFKVPEQVSIDYIAVSMDKILSETQVSDKALRRYYRENLDAYVRAAQWQWAHILIRVPSDATPKAEKIAYQKVLKIEKALHKGGSFAQAAKKNSEDLLSAGKGGMMPWMPESAINVDILTALKTLKEKGISAPIKTEYGYDIIQRVGYQPEKQLPFDDVKAQILNTLKTDKAQEVFADLGDDLTNLSYQNPSSLTETASALDLSVQSTPLFSRKGLPEGIASHKAVVQAAFSDEVLQEGNNSALIAIEDNLLLVLRVNKHKPSSVEPFETVKTVIEEQVMHEKAAVQASEYGKSLINDFKSEPKNATNLIDLKDTQEYKFVWKSQKQVSRDDAELDPKILAVLFQIPPTFGKTPHFQGVRLSNGDYAVLELTHVESGSVEDLDQEEYNTYQDEIDAALGIVDYNLYVEQLMHEAKIIENPK